MSLEQNKIINEADNLNNNNDLDQKISLTNQKDETIVDENKQNLNNDINKDDKKQDEIDELKTENIRKETEDDFIIKIEEYKNNVTNNLINDDNANLNEEKEIEKEKNNDYNNNNKLLENEENKNGILPEEKQEKNNNSIECKNPTDKTEEENKLILENTINEKSKNQLENNLDNIMIKNDFSENEKNKNNIVAQNEINNNEKNEEQNININNTAENTQTPINQEKEESDLNHKLSPSCLNNCVKWTLNAEVTLKAPNQSKPSNNNNKYQCSFTGSSTFFKKLDQSLINCFHNPQNITSPIYRNMNYISLIDSIKADSNKNLTTSNQSLYEQILNISYPIDNSKTTAPIIDNNLSIKENVKNLFLIEFNLEQIIEDEHNFRKINDDCVENELDFKLNGFFHNKKMFQKDLTFSVGYRDFIKSIQFQIKSKIQKNKNFSQNIFFAKVLNNANLGIEFYIPNLSENSQTNFNAIVNSNIELKKIFLELTIPNNFIFGNNNSNNNNEAQFEDSYSISTKRTEINSPKKEENAVSISNSNHNSNKNLNFVNNKNNIINNNNKNNNNLNENINMQNYLFNSNVSSPNFPPLGINRSIQSSPHINNINNYQRLIYQQKYSPLIKSNFVNNNNNNMNFNLLNNNNFQQMPIQNRFYPTTPNYPNYPLSPVPQPPPFFCSPQPNTYSPLSSSLMMMKMPYTNTLMQQRPLSMNSPFNTSNYSSPYLGQNQNVVNRINNTPSINNSSNNRKNSESFQIENQMNNLQRNIYNSNNNTPLITREKKEEYFNQFMSPKSMGPSTSFNLGNNFNMMNFNLNMNRKNVSGYQLNPMNNFNQMKQQMNQMANINQMNNVAPMTIRQKIFEKTKTKNDEYINKLLNSMNRIRTNNNNNINNNNINNININSMNNINNFNNCSTNNSIRPTIIKSSIIQNTNINNLNMQNNFNNFNPIKNLSNIHTIPNNPNVPNIMNMNNNLNINNMNRINNNINSINSRININHEKKEKSEKNEEQKIKNIFMIENQNKTNLDLFIKSIIPIHKLSSHNELLKIKIQNIFDSLKSPSLLGLKNTYYNNGELINMWYSLKLSHIYIKIINKQLISQIFQKIKTRKKLSDNFILKQNEEIIINESFFTLYFTTEYLDINFIESKPDYNRQSYNTIIKSIKNAIPYFDKISLEDIDLTKSFFSILYSSAKILKPFTPHSFLVYYLFTNDLIQDNKTNINNSTNNEIYAKQIIAGILPFKVNNEFFMQKINFNNNMTYKQPIQNYQNYGFFNPDNFPFINITYKILNEIQKYARGNSYDYEHFIKIKNYNYNK